MTNNTRRQPYESAAPICRFSRAACSFQRAQLQLLARQLVVQLLPLQFKRGAQVIQLHLLPVQRQFVLLQFQPATLAPGLVKIGAPLHQTGED
ncbi:MAG: hypothetical protein R3A10_20815 [Caldilineaceae bacterium]